MITLYCGHYDYKSMKVLNRAISTAMYEVDCCDDGCLACPHIVACEDLARLDRFIERKLLEMRDKEDV